MIKLIIALLIYVISSVSLMKIFEEEKKSNLAAWVPIWRSFILLDILGFNRFWFIALIIPIVSQVFAVFLMYELANKYFNYNIKSVIVMTVILWLIPPIGLLLIAYRKKFEKYFS